MRGERRPGEKAGELKQEPTVAPQRMTNTGCPHTRVPVRCVQARTPVRVHVHVLCVCVEADAQE